MVPVVTSAGSVTLLDEDSIFFELLDFGVTLDDDDLAPLLLDFVELLDFSEDEDFALEELDNFAELLLDTLVSLSLDCGVTLEEDDSSQSSHTLEDEPSDGRVAKSLSSSPQAASIAAKDTAIQPTKNFFIVFTYFPKKLRPGRYHVVAHSYCPDSLNKEISRSPGRARELQPNRSNLFQDIR